ncbi:2-C-methyl-D-erythritol 4-phosphate cytidylyltransferase [Glaciecola sp. 1036]|uniref:2-C-methyl-D-erythritol 4-phosphate cytidylyltransferase n=1 Tax=Alteromonadaceae TaxID=72275 RepID=UPI003D02F160
MTTTSYTAVIPAAGIGTRMQSQIPKQYLKVADKYLIEYCIDTFLQHPKIEQIIVVIHPEDKTFSQLSVATNSQVHVVIGGAERADSVLAGIEYAKTTLNSEWVLVHDAARPGLSMEAISRLIDQVKNTDGGILALPATDTIKQSHDGSVDKTLDRNRIWMAQTPQMFKTQALHNAISQALALNIMITDEASAMEIQGIDVKLVVGEAANMKVTQPQDLPLVEFYLNQMESD